jgi:hypothetical protein
MADPLGPKASISDNKLVQFSIGQQKKSRFQKAREDQEAKKKLEEEEAAKVYESFVASFADDDEAKTFVRGGKYNGGSSNRHAESAGEVYRMDGGKKKMSEIDKLMNEMKVRLKCTYY